MTVIKNMTIKVSIFKKHFKHFWTCPLLQKAKPGGGGGYSVDMRYWECVAKMWSIFTPLVYDWPVTPLQTLFFGKRMCFISFQLPISAKIADNFDKMNVNVTNISGNWWKYMGQILVNEWVNSISPGSHPYQIISSITPPSLPGAKPPVKYQCDDEQNTSIYT